MKQHPPHPEGHVGAMRVYRRWFYYLLIASLISISAPYRAKKDSRLHTSEVETFVESDNGLQPTTQRIWVDGVTAARLEDTFWLWTALFLICVELTVGFVRWWASRRRSAPREAFQPARANGQNG